MLRLSAWLFLGVLAALPAWAERAPELTLDDVRAAVQERWGGVRDVTIEDRVTRVEYRQVGPLPIPKTNKIPLSTHPNRWMAAPGLEYLELWQGDKCVRIAFAGTETHWEGQRNAFGKVLGRICEGNNVPSADLTFSYYLGRFGHDAGLIHFLQAPGTRLVKANKRFGDMVCHRVRGAAQLDIDGALKPYEVTVDLAPEYGWLPYRMEFVDAATGQTMRVYRVRSFSTADGFAFPREAQIDVYETPVASGTRVLSRSELTSSLMCLVERVALNRGIAPGDVAFDFTPGTEVRNERTGEEFVIPGGEASESAPR